jgi:hypothetical protein
LADRDFGSLLSESIADKLSGNTQAAYGEHTDAVSRGERRNDFLDAQLEHGFFVVVLSEPVFSERWACVGRLNGQRKAGPNEELAIFHSECRAMLYVISIISIIKCININKSEFEVPF